MIPADLTARRETLRREVSEHKRAIQTRRKQLHHAAAELQALEATLHRLGLGFYTQPGAGAIHGRSDPE